MLKKFLLTLTISLLSFNMTYAEEAEVVIVEEQEEAMISKRIQGLWRFDVERFVQEMQLNLPDNMDNNFEVEFMDSMRAVRILITADEFKVQSPDMPEEEIVPYNIINETPEKLTIELRQRQENAQSTITFEGNHLIIKDPDQTIYLLKAE